MVKKYVEFKDFDTNNFDISSVGIISPKINRVIRDLNMITGNVILTANRENKVIIQDGIYAQFHMDFSVRNGKSGAIVIAQMPADLPLTQIPFELQLQDGSILYMPKGSRNFNFSGFTTGTRYIIDRFTLWG